MELGLPVEIACTCFSKRLTPVLNEIVSSGTSGSESEGGDAICKEVKPPRILHLIFPFSI